MNFITEIPQDQETIDSKLLVGLSEGGIAVYNSDFSLETILNEPQGKVTLLKPIVFNGQGLVVVGTENKELFFYTSSGQLVRKARVDFDSTVEGSNIDVNDILHVQDHVQRGKEHILVAVNNTSKIPVFGAGFEMVVTLSAGADSYKGFELLSVDGKQYVLVAEKEYDQYSVFDLNFQLRLRVSNARGKPHVLKRFSDGRDLLAFRSSDSILIYDSDMALVEHLDACGFLSKSYQVNYQGEPHLLVITFGNIFDKSENKQTLYDSHFNKKATFILEDHYTTSDYYFRKYGIDRVFFDEETGHIFFIAGKNDVVVFDNNLNHLKTINDVDDWYDDDTRQGLRRVSYFMMGGIRYLCAVTCAGQYYVFDTISDYTCVKSGLYIPEYQDTAWGTPRLEMGVEFQHLTLNQNSYFAMVGRLGTVCLFDQTFSSQRRIENPLTNVIKLTGFNHEMDYLAAGTNSSGVLILNSVLEEHCTLETRSKPTHLLQHRF